MKVPTLIFLALGLVFGVAAILFGLHNVEHAHPKELILEGDLPYAAAAIHACGLISAACFIAGGLVQLKSDGGADIKRPRQE